MVSADVKVEVAPACTLGRGGTPTPERCCCVTVELGVTEEPDLPAAHASTVSENVAAARACRQESNQHACWHVSCSVNSLWDLPPKTQI